MSGDTRTPRYSLLKYIYLFRASVLRVDDLVAKGTLQQVRPLRFRGLYDDDDGDDDGDS